MSNEQASSGLARRGMFLLASLLLVISGEMAFPASPRAKESIRFSVDLQDGSRLIGVPGKFPPFATDFITIPIEPEQILSIDLSGKNHRATVSFRNGDRLSGTFKKESIELQTCVGVLKVPFLLVRGIKVSGQSQRPAAYWNFDGNTQDSAGDHLLASREAARFSTGILGQAIAQRGNQEAFRMEMPNDIDMNRDFTISFWAYREESVYDNDAAYDGGGVYIAKRDADGWRSRMGVILSPASGAPAIHLIDNSPTGEPPLCRWFHVVVYRSGDTVRIKVNNAGSASVDLNGVRLENSPFLFIGRQQHGYPWQGSLDEFGIWDHALTDSEIDWLYNNGSGQRPF